MVQNYLILAGTQTDTDKKLVFCAPAGTQRCAGELSAVEFVRTGEADGVCAVETRRRRPGEKEFRRLAVSTYRRVENPSLPAANRFVSIQAKTDESHRPDAT